MMCQTARAGKENVTEQEVINLTGYNSELIVSVVRYQRSLVSDFKSNFIRTI